jgi:hypothetical protein
MLRFPAIAGQSSPLGDELPADPGIKAASLNQVPLYIMALIPKRTLHFCRYFFNCVIF